jgi:PEP-CTERM motif
MQKQLSAFLSSSLLTAGIAGISLGYNVTPVQAFELNFGAASQSSNTPATGSSAKVDFKFTQSGQNVLVNLDIFNTTGETTFGSGATESTLMGFAFDLLDGITIGSFTGSNYFGNIASNVDLQPFDTFDVGISRNSNFLGGNPNGGLTQGLSSSVSFLLSGANLLAETLEQDFFQGFSDGTLKWATRFQAVNAGAGSDKLLGGTITGGPVVEVEQPEVEQPEVEQPEVEQPEVEQPEVEQPEVEQPEVEQPEVEQPEVEQPEVEQPEVVDPQPPAPPVEPELPSEPQPPAPPAEPNYPTEDNPTNNVSVPEPGTLFGLGLVGTLVGLRRRKS